MQKEIGPRPDFEIHSLEDLPRLLNRLASLAP